MGLRFTTLKTKNRNGREFGKVSTTSAAASQHNVVAWKLLALQSGCFCRSLLVVFGYSGSIQMPNLTPCFCINKGLQYRSEVCSCPPPSHAEDELVVPDVRCWLVAKPAIVHHEQHLPPMEAGNVRHHFPLSIPKLAMSKAHVFPNYSKELVGEAKRCQLAGVPSADEVTAAATCLHYYSRKQVRECGKSSSFSFMNK